MAQVPEGNSCKSQNQFLELIQTDTHSCLILSQFSPLSPVAHGCFLSFTCFIPSSVFGVSSVRTRPFIYLYVTFCSHPHATAYLHSRTTLYSHSRAKDAQPTAAASGVANPPSGALRARGKTGGKDVNGQLMGELDGGKDESHQHAHEHPQPAGPSKLSAYLNLFGDFVHNMCVIRLSISFLLIPSYLMDGEQLWATMFMSVAVVIYSVVAVHAWLKVQEEIVAAHW